MMVVAVREFIMGAATTEICAHKKPRARQRFERTVYIDLVEVFAEAACDIRHRQRRMRALEDTEERKPALCGAETAVSERGLELAPVLPTIVLHVSMLPSGFYKRNLLAFVWIGARMPACHP